MPSCIVKNALDFALGSTEIERLCFNTKLQSTYQYVEDLSDEVEHILQGRPFGWHVWPFRIDTGLTNDLCMHNGLLTNLNRVLLWGHSKWVSRGVTLRSEAFLPREICLDVIRYSTIVSHDNRMQKVLGFHPCSTTFSISALINYLSELIMGWRITSVCTMGWWLISIVCYCEPIANEYREELPCEHKPSCNVKSAWMLPVTRQ